MGNRESCLPIVLPLIVLLAQCLVVSETGLASPSVFDREANRTSRTKDRNLGVTAAATADFNGDGRTDYAVWRNNGGQLTWFWNTTQVAGFQAQTWGLVGDVLLMEDFDGDNKDDIAVWRAGVSQSVFFIIQSLTGTARIESFGLLNDDPTVVGDYDGDGKADVAVYRPGAMPGQQSTWFYRASLNNPSGNITFVPWGVNGDKVAPGDYNGDGRNDFVVRRDGAAQSVWWLKLSTGAVTAQGFGLAGDFIVPGDYDGDGRTDITSLRSNGFSLTWYYLASSTGSFNAIPFGLQGDFIVQGDYDDDGRTDPAIWRSGNPGRFWSLNSSNGAARVFDFGGSNDGAVIHSYNRH